MKIPELKEFGATSETIPCERCGIVTLTIDGVCYDCCKYDEMKGDDDGQ